MSIVRLAWSYLAARPLLTALHIVMLATGVATMILLILFTAQTEERLERDARPVDLVVGAKGSPMQLILSSIFQLDVPTGNIKLSQAQFLARNRMVRTSAPVSLGDNVRQVRIVRSASGVMMAMQVPVDSPTITGLPMSMPSSWNSEA